MSRTVMCLKLGREAEGLEYPPFKGDLGKRIYDSISKEGWLQWVRHSTMLINEYRLNPSDPEAQKLLREHMEKFLFTETEAELPPDFKPQES